MRSPWLFDAAPVVNRRVLVAAAVVLTVVVEGLVVWRYRGLPELPAVCFLGVLFVVLSLFDVVTHRLPKVIVWPSYPVALALLAIGAADGAGWPAFWRAVEAMACCGAGYLALAIGLPGFIGLGDVRVAGLVGAFCGFVSWPDVVAGVTFGWWIGLAATLPDLLSGRLAMRAKLTIGQFVLAGAVVAVLLRA